MILKFETGLPKAPDGEKLSVAVMVRFKDNPRFVVEGVYRPKYELVDYPGKTVVHVNVFVSEGRYFSWDKIQDWIYASDLDKIFKDGTEFEIKKVR